MWVFFCKQKTAYDMRIRYGSSDVCSSDRLITGAPGVGKDVAARVLHGWSGRQNAPFRVISSARMDPETVEAELFGTESDDGAIRVGLLEPVHDGTLFLEEVADMSLTTTGKILRVLT